MDIDESSISWMTIPYIFDKNPTCFQVVNIAGQNKTSSAVEEICNQSWQSVFLLKLANGINETVEWIW